MTQAIVIALVCLVGVLVLLESKRRGPRRDAVHDSDDEAPRSVISADEADPTQSGRYRAMKVKAEIQKARQAAQPVKPKEEPRSDLPDPFNVELQDGE